MICSGVLVLCNNLWGIFAIDCVFCNIKQRRTFFRDLGYVAMVQNLKISEWLRVSELDAGT